MNEKSKLLTIQDVAALMSISSRQVWKLISSKQIRVVRIGERCTRVSVQELDRFLSELAASGADAAIGKVSKIG